MITTEIKTETNLLRENSFKIIGNLTKADVTTGIAKNGKAFVSVNAEVQSQYNGYTHEFTKIKFFAFELTKNGEKNKLYESYIGLDKMIGNKVEIDGEIRENRYFSPNLNQIVSSQEFSAKFVKSVSNATQDTGTFTLGGFLVKTPVEKVNKDGDVYRYEVSIGQANYNGTMASMFNLHIDPNRRDVLSSVESLYAVGDTVQLGGSLDFRVENVMIESKETAFGTPVTRMISRKQSNFYIESGLNPITDETAYSMEKIQELINAYKANDVTIQQEATSKASSTPAPTMNVAPTVTKRQASLL